MNKLIAVLGIFLALSIPKALASGAQNLTDIHTFLSAALATANQNSGEISMRGYSAAGLQVSFAVGTPNGTLTVQSSGDCILYDTMPGISPITVTTTALQQIDITKTAWACLKMTWTNSSSTAGTTITMKAVRKNY